MFTKLCRIGNDPIVRFTKDGGAVMSLSLAYQYGRKGEDGKRPTQWLDASMWGKQAEATQPYLQKGDQITVCINDLHIEMYEGKNGTSAKLAGHIVSFDFASGKHEPKSHVATTENKNTTSPKGAFDNFDDDIPF